MQAKKGVKHINFKRRYFNYTNAYYAYRLKIGVGKRLTKVTDFKYVTYFNYNTVTYSIS